MSQIIKHNHIQMHKPKCINHDSRTGFKVGLLGRRYTTIGHDDDIPQEDLTIATNQTLGSIKDHPQPHKYESTPLIAKRVPRYTFRH